MRVLVACETSGIVSQAFCKYNHYTLSCDLLPSEQNQYNHILDDVLNILKTNQFDLLIAHPPCTYLSSSGLHWNKRRPEREEKTERALDFVRSLMNAPVRHICIENPVGCVSTRIHLPTQYIQPYNFGHDASKKTGLWLTNLPPLQPTSFVEPRIVDGKKRWGNQTDLGQNRLGESKARQKLRSRTYEGIAAAMANQWIPYIKEVAK